MATKKRAGRKPVADPLRVPISFRITDSMAKLLDAEHDRLKKERGGGQGLSRNDVARELMGEALYARMVQLAARRPK